MQSICCIGNSTKLLCNSAPKVLRNTWIVYFGFWNRMRMMSTHNEVKSPDKNDIALDQFDKVAEGKAEILFPKETGSVFYNPVQEFNRDLTTAVITEFVKEELQKKSIKAVEYSEEDPNVLHLIEEVDPCEKIVYPGEKCEEGISILEALSATGLRSIRFAKEVPGVKRIVANDISTDAYKTIVQNIAHNNVEEIVKPHNADATMLMYEHRSKEKSFDVVDIDPYGSASIFLDSAVQSVKHGGLLCVTCTDMANLAGNFPDACWAKYQSLPMKWKAAHEQGLRILLSSISSHASRYSRYIEPLLSISIDFYIRVFVRVHYSPAKAKDATGKQAYVYRCGGCGTYHCHNVVDSQTNKTNTLYYPAVGPPVPARCVHCNHKHRMGGPFWSGPLHNVEFVNKILASLKAFPNRFGSIERLLGNLTMASEELPDVPFYYVIDELSKTIRCNSPPTKVLRSAILNAGYRVSSFHGKMNSLKTDTPHVVLWDIMRKWAETQKINRAKIQEDSPAKALLDTPVTTENIDFTVRDDAEPRSKTKGISRFPQLPPFWGPKARAKIVMDGTVKIDESLQEKSKRFQGKRSKDSDGTESKKLKQS